ncbi:hypothetical protein [Pseudomonas violetae]|uniref:Uncharacterized protein n=1 Tax=Pseudomonas violetae TaxID=2915813 RepID=A0ABT0EV38_9PSED|nr:hypothetical protein [Pseudomonas violetae]MCK1789602.1 hypothetical protein [Pseudomonas violetae]
MSKLPNGIRVISYKLSLYPLRGCASPFFASGKRLTHDRSNAINASGSIAFAPVDYHQLTSGSQS